MERKISKGVQVQILGDEFEVSINYQFEDIVTDKFQGEITVRLLYPIDEYMTIAQVKAKALRDAPEYLKQTEFLDEPDF